MKEEPEDQKLSIKLKIDVVDTGNGIHKNNYGKIMNLFKTRDIRKDAIQDGGLGLGLIVCKGLAKALGGYISV